MKILAVRADGLGDLILTLPALEIISSVFPGADTHVLVRDDLTVVTENFPFVSKTIPLSLFNKSTFPKERYDMSVFFRFNSEIAFKIFRICKRRHGRLSAPLSFLLLNRGMRQRRSRSEKNEAQYNIDLVRHASGSDVREEPKPRVFFDIKEFCVPSCDYAVLSPQMKGSAKNLDDSIYAKAAQICADSKLDVVLTGTGACPVTRDIKNKLKDRCSDLSGKTDLRELAFVLSKSNIVIAPSTGTLHLANALGKKIFSVFPKSGATCFKRWHPWKYSGIILTCEAGKRNTLDVPEKTLEESLLNLLKS
ncbi:glycosyltransferase family 9 protein [candidate division WOR-3 bacterium]|nr:glycosyltransferase family 9 protein [candidate division WOR-3 bacterium]